MSDVQATSPQTQRTKAVRLSPEISEFLSILSALEHQAQDRPVSTEKQR